jgi:putative ABC transport system permease protein
MNGITDISYLNLALSLGLLAVPFALFGIFRIKLIKDSGLAILRMIVQLSLVAVYLEWIFEQNNAAINLLWVAVMLGVGIVTTIRRVKLKFKFFIAPLIFSGVLTLVIIDSFFLGFVIRPDYFF